MQYSRAAAISGKIVAPPRGERGLKYKLSGGSQITRVGRSPSWGAWIEILPLIHVSALIMASLPLVGSVD